MGIELAQRVTKLRTEEGWFDPPSDLSQNQTRKWDGKGKGGPKVALLRAIEEIPAFLQRRIQDRLMSNFARFNEFVVTPASVAPSELRDWALQSSEWILQEHAYRLVIASFERDVTGCFVFPPKGTVTLERFQDVFRVSDEGEITRAYLVFVVMTHVSYVAIRERTHPAARQAEWIKRAAGWVSLETHVGRDVRFGKDLLERAKVEKDVCRSVLSFLMLEWPDRLRLPVEEDILRLRFQDLTDDVGMRYKSPWRLRVTTECPEMCAVCLADVLRQNCPKPLSTIYKNCPSVGLYHQSFGDDCSYVCVLCGKTGHPAWKCIHADKGKGCKNGGKGKERARGGRNFRANHF
jgi:hypothetical protein